MNATLKTRSTAAVRNARSSAVAARTRFEVRTDESSGAVIVRGCAHSTGARRIAGGSRTGELHGIGRRGIPADSASTLTLRGVLPVRVEGQESGNGPAAGRGSGEPAGRAAAGATLLRLTSTDQAEATGDDHITEFTAYVRERRASLYATAYHLTGDRHEAEDLLQSALFSTYRAWGRITDKAAVGGYLRRTMTNLHISAWRRRKVNEYPTEELPETVGDTDAMGGTELRAVLWQALAKLPENQRTMLVLRYYEGRTDPEIADILGISVGTVKSSIWRALRRLRDDEQLNRTGDTVLAFGELVA
ncbi:SigE family RNA polymerase sigma factor [Kitasatospora sp. GP82]|uniref:SigE family RNA polymerase sigma factor n=1 Tax=Kitasatospora sp. GP82 TaxID=3035089 RepID=UPI0024757301|nr:SigE family RNA polymerase sigma factor [Kitasatospora sp. GP82]MDH6124149.1 RNA polymerase sigma-70 factor (sigma-E family) [Kitasatospora sp. GP82]